MSGDLLDVQDLDTIGNAEMDGLVRRLEEVLHERQRRVPERTLAGHELAQLEQPQPELEVAVLPLEHAALDEGAHQTVQRRLRQARRPRPDRPG